MKISEADLVTIKEALQKQRSSGKEVGFLEVCCSMGSPVPCIVRAVYLWT
jgi:hypothetical protein